MIELGDSLFVVNKRCFVISPFGKDADEQKRYEQVLNHLIKHVLEPDYDVKRFDEIDETGLIRNQIIERLLDDELVVADLTDRTPTSITSWRSATPPEPVVDIIRQISGRLTSRTLGPSSTQLPVSTSSMPPVNLRAKSRAIETMTEPSTNPVTAARAVSPL